MPWMVWPESEEQSQESSKCIGSARGEYVLNTEDDASGEPEGKGPV